MSCQKQAWDHSGNLLPSPPWPLYTVPANWHSLKLLKCNTYPPRETKSHLAGNVSKKYLRLVRFTHQIRTEDFKAHHPFQLCLSLWRSVIFQSSSGMKARRPWHLHGISEVSHFLSVSDSMLEHFWNILLGAI